MRKGQTHRRVDGMQKVGVRFRQAQHKVGIDIGKANCERIVKHLQKLLRRVQTSDFGKRGVV